MNKKPVSRCCRAEIEYVAIAGDRFPVKCKECGKRTTPAPVTHELNGHCTGCTDKNSEGTHQGCTIEHGHVGCEKPEKKEKKCGCRYEDEKKCCHEDCRICHSAPRPATERWEKRLQELMRASGFHLGDGNGARIEMFVKKVLAAELNRVKEERNAYWLKTMNEAIETDIKAERQRIREEIEAEIAEQDNAATRDAFGNIEDEFTCGRLHGFRRVLYLLSLLEDHKDNS